MAQHIKRENYTDKLNEYIDDERSHLNYSLKEGRGSSSEIREALKERLSTVNRKIRKDAVRVVQFNISGSPERMNELSDKQQKQYFKDSLKVVEKMMGKENVLSADVHMDEKTPHMHILTTPVTEDGHLHFKSYINGREALIRVQDKFGDIGKKYGLNRGLRGSRAKHQDLKEYEARRDGHVKRVEKKFLETDKKNRLEQSKEIIQSVHDRNIELQERVQYMESIFNVDGIDKIMGLDLRDRDTLIKSVEKMAHDRKIQTAKNVRIEKERLEIERAKNIQMRKQERAKNRGQERDKDRGMGW